MDGRRNVRSVVGNKNMKIKVASKNPVKVEAVREMLKEYQHLASAGIYLIEAGADV
mgnify:CR=1 FL=1